MTDVSADALGIIGNQIVDLAQPLERNIPTSPNHPGYEMALIRRHGDMMRPDGGSAANEIIVFGGHVGTHIDALAHVSHDGLLHGGIDARDVTSNAGFETLGVDEIPPIVCRGALLDLVEVFGRPLEAGEEITPKQLQEAESASGQSIQPGDAVLIRTGWSSRWTEPSSYLGQSDGAPGPGESGAEWLAERQPRLVGAETVAFEHIPPGQGHKNLPGHRVLLVEAGIYIVENMNLSTLAEAETREFLFILAPLPLVGATGSPCRPIAVLQQT